jgi:hypothetical protein
MQFISGEIVKQYQKKIIRCMQGGRSRGAEYAFASSPVKRTAQQEDDIGLCCFDDNGN